MNFFGIFLPRLAGNMAEYDHVTNKLACYLSWRGYTCKQLIRHTEIPASVQSHDQVSFSPQALISPSHITILFSTLHLTIHAVVIASLVTYRLVWIWAWNDIRIRMGCCQSSEPEDYEVRRIAEWDSHSFNHHSFRLLYELIDLNWLRHFFRVLICVCMYSLPVPYMHTHEFFFSFIWASNELRDTYLPLEVACTWSWYSISISYYIYM